MSLLLFSIKGLNKIPWTTGDALNNNARRLITKAMTQHIHMFTRLFVTDLLKEKTVIYS